MTETFRQTALKPEERNRCKWTDGSSMSVNSVKDPSYQSVPYSNSVTRAGPKWHPCIRVYQHLIVLTEPAQARMTFKIIDSPQIQSRMFTQQL